MAGPDGDDLTEEAPEAEVAADDGVFDRALSQFYAICQAYLPDRAEMLQDRRFVTVTGAQWEGDWGDQFQNSIMVEINKTALGVEKIITDYRANRLTVEFRSPTGSGPDEETAETLNGMFLADVYTSKGQQAFDGGFEEAVQGGMGAWRLCARYVDEYDPDDDAQRIGFEWIPDADQSVFFDMDARLYDKSDAKHCFVISAISPEAYVEEFGDDPASWPEAILKPYYEWYTPEVVRIAEYYRKVEKTEDRLTFEHVMTGERKKLWRSELEPGDIKDMQVRGWRQTGRKPVKRCRIEKLTFSANGEIAPRQIIPGDQIPIVPVYGKRAFIDNKERVRGHVRLAKDPQRIYNGQITKLSETSALTPIEVPVFTPEQIQGHENEWAFAHINRSPYLLINATKDGEGNILPPQPVAKITPPTLPPVLGALVQITANDINELTLNDDNTNEVQSNVSAEAMDLAATRTDARTFSYTDNMRQSMQRTGEVYLSMARELYVEEGREVPTMDEEGQHGSATLLEPSVNDKGQFYLANDFNSVKLNVIADVTEATSTRRDKTVKALLATAETLAPFDPQGAAAMIGVAVQNMDGEGVADLKDWNRQRLVQQGVLKPTDEEKEQMAQAAAAQQGQPPSPQAQVLQAQVQKEQALTVKAQADTELAKAQSIKYIADAHKAHAQASSAPIEAQQKDEQHRVSILDKLTKFFTGREKQAAGQK